MTNVKITREFAGLYNVTDGTKTVQVEYMDHLKGWMAISQWDRYLYTDVIETKREAVLEAKDMLEEAY